MTRYLFALTDAGGTVPPELGAVRRVLGLGHQVTVLGDASMADAVTAAGADFRAWTEPTAPVEDWRKQSPLAMAKMMADQMFSGPAPGHARDSTAAISELEPDAVVTSFTAVGAMIAAEAAGLPHAVLIPNIYALPAPGMPPFGLGLKPLTGPIGRLRDRAISGISTSTFDRFAKEPVNEVRRSYGLSDLSSAWGQASRAQRLLILTAAAFDFPAELPATARYVGPVLDDPAWAAGEWHAPEADRPLVVVAMSSTFQDHVDCLQRTADALGSLEVRGLLTTGPAVDPGLVRASGHVQVVRSVPHSQAFPRAAAIVTHGGHGTVMKALAADVPMVVMPHGRDQPDNARRLTERGAAVALSRGSSSEKIAQAIERVLDGDDYRRAAARLGEHVRSEAAAGTLVEELESLV